MQLLQYRNVRYGLHDSLIWEGAKRARHLMAFIDNFDHCIHALESVCLNQSRKKIADTKSMSRPMRKKIVKMTRYQNPLAVRRECQPF